MLRPLRVLMAVALCLALAWAPLAPAHEAPAFNPESPQAARRLALDSFLQAAFSAEYGDTGRDALIRWEEPIRLSLSGNYTREDEAFLEEFLLTVEEQAADGFDAFPGIRRVSERERPNMRVIYCPLEEMGNHLSSYQTGNWGYFEYYYLDYRMDEATVVVATDVTTQRQRNHLLMEEIVGSLGLTNDIHTFSDSIVYQPWTETQQLSDLDWLMLSYLYSDRVRLGMTAQEAYDALLPVVDMDWEGSNPAGAPLEISPAGR